MPSTTAVIAAAVVLLVLVIMRRRKAASKCPKQVTRAATGLAVDAGVAVADGLPFHHVRVVDLSTVLAGPIAARIMADLGAEVIKVEDKRGGDPFRKTFLEYEPGRVYGSAFEMANLGKVSAPPGVVGHLTLRGRTAFVVVLNIAFDPPPSPHPLHHLSLSLSLSLAAPVVSRA